MLNYLALLGWSMGGDRELFTLAEMAEAFTLEKVSRNPARFDLKKLTVINGIKIRELEPADLVRRLLPFLVRAGLLASPVSDAQLDLVAAAAPLVQERAGTLVEAAGLLGFLLVPDHHFEVDAAAGAKVLTDAAAPVLDAAVTVLDGLPTWTTEDIQEALQAALVEALGLKPQGRVRAGAGRRDRAHGLAAALRVPGAARAGPHPRPAPGGPCRFGVDSGDGLTSSPGAPSRWALRLGYGVIGSPTDSGSVSLGSSPGTPAPQHHRDTARPRRLEAQDAALSRR